MTIQFDLYGTGNWTSETINLSIGSPTISIPIGTGIAVGGSGEQLSGRLNRFPGGEMPPPTLVADTADRNGDGIPDFANVTGSSSNGPTGLRTTPFTPVDITIPEAWDLPTTYVNLIYYASDPNLVASFTDPASGNTAYSPSPAAMRLWQTNGDVLRNPKSFMVGGDYVPFGVYSLSHLTSSMGVTLGPSDLTLHFYIEAIGQRPFPEINSCRQVFRWMGVGRRILRGPPR